MYPFQQNAPESYTPSELAEILKVKTSTIYAWISRREIASVKCGTSRFITLLQIQELYKNRQISDFIDRTYADGPKR